MTRHALVIDDDPVSQLVVQHMLVRDGWTVLGGDSVAQALELVAATSVAPTVIICDYHMPGGSGLDLHQRLKELGNESPFLLLTGVGEQAELDDDRVKEIAGFLTKPVHSADLVAAIEAAIETAIGEGAHAAPH